jgi:hypothetical protein
MARSSERQIRGSRRGGDVVVLGGAQKEYQTVCQHRSGSLLRGNNDDYGSGAGLGFSERWQDSGIWNPGLSHGRNGWATESRNAQPTLGWHCWCSLCFVLFILVVCGIPCVRTSGLRAAIPAVLYILPTSLVLGRLPVRRPILPLFFQRLLLLSLFSLHRDIPVVHAGRSYFHGLVTR